MTAQASSWGSRRRARNRATPRPWPGSPRRGGGVGDVAGVLGDSRDQRCQARCGPLLQCRRGQQPSKALAGGRDSAKVFHMSGTRTGPARDRPAQVAVGVDDRRAAAGANPGATSAARRRDDSGVRVNIHGPGRQVGVDDLGLVLAHDRAGGGCRTRPAPSRDGSIPGTPGSSPRMRATIYRW